MKKNRIIIYFVLMLLIVCNFSSCARTAPLPINRLLTEFERAVNEQNEEYFKKNMYIERDELLFEDLLEVCINDILDFVGIEQLNSIQNDILKNENAGLFEKVYAVLENDIRIAINAHEIMLDKKVPKTEKKSYERAVIVKIYTTVQYGTVYLNKERYLKYVKLTEEKSWKFQYLTEEELIIEMTNDSKNSETAEETMEIITEFESENNEIADSEQNNKELTVKLFIDNTASTKGFITSDAKYQKLVNKIENIMKHGSVYTKYTLQDEGGNLKVYTSQELEESDDFLKWREYKAPIAQKLKSKDGDGYYAQAEFESEFDNPISLIIEQKDELNIFDPNGIIVVISDLHDQGQCLSTWGQDIRKNFLDSISEEEKYGAAIFVLNLPFEGTSWINDPNDLNYENELQAEFKGEKKPISILIAGNIDGVIEKTAEFEKVLKEEQVDYNTINNLVPAVENKFSYEAAKSITKSDVKEIRKDRDKNIEDLIGFYCVRLVPTVDVEPGKPNADMCYRFEKITINKHHKKDIIWTAFYPKQVSDNNGNHKIRKMVSAVSVQVYQENNGTLRKIPETEWIQHFRIKMDETIDFGTYMGIDNTSYVNESGHASKELGIIRIEALDTALVEENNYYFEFKFETVIDKCIKYPNEWIKQLDYDLSCASVETEKVWHTKIFNLDAYIRGVMGMTTTSTELICTTIEENLLTVALLGNGVK